MQSWYIATHEMFHFMGPVLVITLSQNWLQKKIPHFRQHGGSILSLINATQSLTPVEKYGTIEPYSSFREK